MKWIATSCKEIQVINFSFCRGITAAGFQELTQSPQKFKHLDFSNCVHVNDSLIGKFKLNFVNLESLTLRNCNKISDAVAIHLARNARKLKKLDVRGCPLVTFLGIRLILHATNKKVVIEMDIEPEKRNILPVGYPGKNRAMELSLREVFMSFPKESKSFKNGMNGEEPSIDDINVKKFIKSKVKRSMSAARKRTSKSQPT